MICMICPFGSTTLAASGWRQAAGGSCGSSRARGASPNPDRKQSNKATKQQSNKAALSWKQLLH
jgi:hypothetical protein